MSNSAPVSTDTVVNLMSRNVSQFTYFLTLSMSAWHCAYMVAVFGGSINIFLAGSGSGSFLGIFVQFSNTLPVCLAISLFI
jgi:hypothetical protein